MERIDPKTSMSELARRVRDYFIDERGGRLSYSDLEDQQRIFMELLRTHVVNTYIAAPSES